MRNFLKMMKRWDFIVIFSLVVLSFLPLIIFSITQAEDSGEDTVYVAVVSVDNKEVQRIVLTGNTDEEVFDVHYKDKGVNTIEVVKDQIRIKSADCSDQVCVHTGFISKPGETIVCLPNKVLIEIKNVNPDNDDELIISS